MSSSAKKPQQQSKVISVKPIAFLEQMDEPLVKSKIMQLVDDDMLSSQAESERMTITAEKTSQSIYDKHSSSTEYKVKMLELEMEREESEKALQLLKQMREQERRELRSGMERFKEEASKETESLRNQMTTRFEKQLVTIENLIRDKAALSTKVEELTNAHLD